jgi:CubicO group peptidase (beta-lactamase class C family)
MNMARLTFLVFTAFFYINCTFAQNPTYSKDIEEKIKQVENNLSGWVKLQDNKSSWSLQDRMKIHNIPGVSVAVIRNYKVEWARGYGYADTADKRMVTPNTLFQAASTSKSVNAMGVLQLADKKLIDINKDISIYLTSWKFPEDSFTRDKKITIAHLLSHTGGLTIHGFPGYAWTDSLPTDNDILNGTRPANTRAVKSQFAPGVRYQYSGGGTTITKKIIMDQTGQAYDMYMWKQVLEPIGMTKSFYTQPPPPQSFKMLATAHRVNGTPVKGKFHIYPEQAPDGLWTTPTDIGNFIIEMQLSLQGKSNKVLSKEMATTMVTPFIDKSAALGVFIDTRNHEKYFQHGGANEGFRCQYYGSIENGNGVAVMVNSDNGAIISEIINSVATVYEWKDFYKPTVKKEVKVPLEKLQSYTGDYTLNTNRFTFAVDKDRLYISQNGNKPVPVYFTSESAFFIFEVPAEMEFTATGGKIDAFMIKQNGGEYKAKKKIN